MASLQFSEIEEGLDALKEQNIAEYLALFPELVLDILEEPEIKNAKGELGAWIARVLYRNVPISDVAIGIMVYQTLIDFVGEEKAAPAKKDCFAIGWVLCFIVSALNIQDDIIDNSESRGFRKCWYLVDSIGVGGATNDAQLLFTCAQITIDRHFKNNPKFLSFYAKLNADLNFKFGIKNQIDVETSTSKIYTDENLAKMRKYESGFGSWIFAACGLHLAGVEDAEILRDRKAMHYALDAYVLDHDDFSDCFGSLEESAHQNVTAETGNDIEEGKCSWCIVQAMKLVTPEDKQILLENYGRKKESTQENRQIVLDIFLKYGLPDKYRKYIDAKYEEIMAGIEKMKQKQPVAFFNNFYKLHHRNTGGSTPESETEAGNQQIKSANEVYKNITNVQSFLSILPEITHNFYKTLGGNEFLNITPWITKMFYYNTPRGKKSRGLTTVMAYQMLNGDQVSKNGLEKAYALGWCIEMLQASALIADDIMDSSVKRRGRLCWYKEGALGMPAINDAWLLLAAVFSTLKFYLGDRTTAHKRISDLFYSVLYKTALGQHLDLTMGESVDFNKFTMENYLKIVKYKTSYYTIYLPVVIAMSLEDSTEKEMTPDTMQYLLDIGDFFQVQDDYLDCFGDEEGIGKVGTDIADGKCSWLIVSALERATPEQKQRLKDNYGYGLADKEKIKTVKEIYNELELQKLFHEYEEETHELMEIQIDQMSQVSQQQKDVFRKILEHTYMRKA